MKNEKASLPSNSRASGKTGELRRRAETQSILRGNEVEIPKSDADLQRLVHELLVHQIELEMQNEELRRTRAELESSLERYTDLYDFAPVGYFTLTADGIIHQLNLYGAHLLGLERTFLVGRRFNQFVAEGRSPTFTVFLAQVFASRVRQTCEVMVQKEVGEPTWVQIEAIAATDGQECRLAVQDIHARKLAEMKLIHMSMHDALTGLYNRGYFIESMERLEHGRQYPISILMADVNHLKYTNDHQGHASGDALLKRVAQVLTRVFRGDDVIARIGGDEFAVLLPNTSAKTAAETLSRLQTVLQEHNTNYFTEPPLSLATGISTAAEFGVPLSETLKEADAAMYHHKRG